ncbi:MAG: SWIM zinc finger family protein [Planctomycetes bacterium]|nr:SWIM zinc finger family protein [Planctomycetota bacterium]
MGYGQWRAYVPVSKRRAKAAKAMQKLRKKGMNIQPITIQGRTIATTFWGRAWCEHLEKFSDYENRLPRGRTYVRNGSVCHLDVQKGKIEAKVSGSSTYDVEISIKTLSAAKWKNLQESSAGQVGSALELIQGKLSEQVMAIMTDRDQGLFPLPGEIALDCSCPDWADMCKHVAAVLYGVGARLDEKPELLFLLRGVDHTELIGENAAEEVVSRMPARKERVLNEQSLSDVFGIELAGVEPPRDVENDTQPVHTAGKARKKKVAPAKGGAVKKKGASTTRRTAKSSSVAKAKAKTKAKAKVKAKVKPKVKPKVKVKAKHASTKKTVRENRK